MDKGHQKRFISLCEKHGISGTEREFWLVRLANAPGDICENILALFENFPAEIGWFSEIQKKKESAAAKNDSSARKALLEEEESHLVSLLNK